MCGYKQLQTDLAGIGKEAEDVISYKDCVLRSLAGFGVEGLSRSDCVIET